MNLQCEEKDIFYNVNIGQVFKCQNAFWVCLNFDWSEEKYPAICIKVDGNEVVDRGDLTFFENDTEVEICTLTK